jgi:polyphenol oxidase
VTVAPAPPPGVEPVAEMPDGAGLYVHPGWSSDFPWVAQGITGGEADMSLFGGAPAGSVVPRWQQLRDRLLFRSMAHSRQVHGADVLFHDDVSPGLLIASDADGHATRTGSVLLAVSVGDCVPIFIVAPEARAVALLHGGWRGIAAGILERGIELLTSGLAAPSDLHVHFGPAICGECYEVGPEVPAGLGLPHSGITHIDLRAHAAHRAIAAGVHMNRITMSEFCTRHGGSPFFSHRGGCPERQIAVLGIRDI